MKIIKRRNIVISLILICFVLISLNIAFAVNETDFVDDNILSAETTDDEIQLSAADVFDAVSRDNDDEIIAQNASREIISDPVKTIEVTQDNYENYFDVRTGKIIDGAGISSGDTLKIGNISNRAFVIDRQLTLMPISPNDEISNGFIHLIKGSDGSTITNLTINNTKGTLTLRGVTVGQLHGIWLSNSNDNLISYNTIRVANTGGVYAMPMGWSSNNRIIYNDMKTYVTCNIIMGQCHNNLISHNSLEVLSYSDLSVTNLIYFNPFGHADYTGSPLCKGNVISYNYLKGYCNMPMSIIIQAEYASHDGTVVANNTIIKGSFGVNLNGDNVEVYGNRVINSGIGISTVGKNATVNNNNIIGDSQGNAIQASGGAGDNIKVFGNNVTFTDVSSAITTSGNADIYNNVVNIKGYGTGIYVSKDHSNVFNNSIRTYHDAGISNVGSYNWIDNNIVTTKNIGINIPGAFNGNRYYNNTITNNKITSEGYGIYVEGLVYNTIITDNIIESNSTEGIYVYVTDPKSNTQLDNMVNGIILNSTAIVVNDDNFYQYFDENGYLTYEFEENKTKIIFLTFLTNKNLFFTDKINVISNRMNNLLFNVTLNFEGDSGGSLIRDFNFVNYDKEAIILNNVDDVTVTRNNITEVFKNGCKSNSAILVQDVCENSIISYNNIYVNSKIRYAYGISAPAVNPSTKRMNTRLSKGSSVLGNTIIMISNGVAEAIYVDSMSDSEFSSNKINIICDSYGYGIAFANLIGKLSGLNVTGNEIIIHSKEMAYLIEFHMVDNSSILNNRLYSESNGVYGIATYMSNNISIENNDIVIYGGNLSSIMGISDVLGIGNSAIAVIKDTNYTAIMGNVIYTNMTNPIILVNLTDEQALDMSSNAYVIDDYNYAVYFDEEGNLYSNMIAPNSILLLNNLTKGQTLKINFPVDISSYDKSIPSTVSVMISEKASNMKIYNISFVNSTIDINGASNVEITDNIFNSTNSNILNILNGQNNEFANNEIYLNSNDVSGIILNNSLSNVIKDNNFKVNGSAVKIIINEDATASIIENNIFEATSNDLIFIYSKNSNQDNVVNNKLTGIAESVFGYYASKVTSGKVSFNNIQINGTGNVTNQAAVYYADGSNDNVVMENFIVDFSNNSDDYAVVSISTPEFFNTIVKNFLVSSNGSKRSDFAVDGLFDIVHSNTPMDIYVSENGSDVTGGGTIYAPYATLSKAVENAFNHCTIYILDGNYLDSDIYIDKNLTVAVVNPGNVTINANSKQLFNIGKTGILSISDVIIENAHNVDGGSVFINNGKLYIYNSIICNSSSYYDNSNPVFDHDVTYNRDGDIETAYTLDCHDTGKGGAILNNGELVISSSVFYNNLGHWGGAIADYGKTYINSSMFYDNEGVHGGVIYTDSKSPLTIENSIFNSNTALTSLDYCTIKLSTVMWSIVDGNHYKYSSECNTPVGSGGVIYTNNTPISISDSSFSDNSAQRGGVIATQIDSFTTTSTFDPVVDLNLDKCYFFNNRANDTRRALGTVDLDYYEYYNGYDGGVVYGTFNKLYIQSSEFYYNQATTDGGVLYAKANDGKILDSVFRENIAGLSGGALKLGKNFLIMRTVISNNTARYGGAIEYDSYRYYGHIQDYFNIYNSTISSNKALNQGGAFNVGSGNIVVHDSNIVNNFAPAFNTIHSMGGSYSIDMRYNYWGISPTGYDGPDNSVWNVNNNQFRPWYRQWVSWEPSVVNVDPTDPTPTQPDNPGPTKPVNPNQGSGNSNNPNPTSTGSSTATGTSIGGNGNGNGQGNGYGNGNGNGNGYSGSGDGNNLGPGSGGTGHGGFSNLPGYSAYDGQSIRGTSNSNGSSNVDSKVDGTVNSDSLSKSNSSNYNPDLASIGMTVNAAAAPSSSQGGSQGAGESSSSSSSGGAANVAKSYEITEKLEEIIDNDVAMLTFIVMEIIVLSLLIIGYKRKEKENEDNY
ncbi:right-handed parallel beta-helix repeat-containing protein [Methanobrevibacter sp.]